MKSRRIGIFPKTCTERAQAKVNINNFSHGEQPVEPFFLLEEAQVTMNINNFSHEEQVAQPVEPFFLLEEAEVKKNLTYPARFTDLN